MKTHQIEATLSSGAGCAGLAGRQIGVAASLVASAARPIPSTPTKRIQVQGETIEMAPQGEVVELAPNSQVIDLGKVSLIPWGQ